MPTYKNLYINGKAVNLVNGSPLKNIVIDDVVYEPEAKGGRYKHRVELYVYRDYTDGSNWSSSYNNYAYNTLDVYIVFYNNSPDKITSEDGLEDGIYPSMSSAEDGVFYLESNSSGYRRESTSVSSSSHPFTKVNEIEIYRSDGKVYVKATLSNGTVLDYNYEMVYPYSNTSWQSYFNLGSAASGTSGRYLYRQGNKITDTVTDTQA